MRLLWTKPGLDDLVRLGEFLWPVNKPAAVQVVQSNVAAPAGLLEYPYLGERVPDFEPREVRRLLVREKR